MPMSNNRFSTESLEGNIMNNQKSIKYLLIVLFIMVAISIPCIAIAGGTDETEPGANCTPDQDIDYLYSTPPYVGTLNFKESTDEAYAEIFGTVYRTGNQKYCSVAISEDFPLRVYLEDIPFSDLKSVDLQGYCDTEIFEPDPGGCDDWGTLYLELVSVGSMAWWQDDTGFTANVTLKGVKPKLQ